MARTTRREWVEAYEDFLGVPAAVSGPVFDQLARRAEDLRAAATAAFEPVLADEKELEIAVAAALLLQREDGFERAELAS